LIGDAELARRLEKFQAAVCAEFGQEILEVGDGRAVFAGVGSPVTQAIGVDSDVERIESFFFERGADSIIQVTPWSSREFLDALTARRYRFHEFENVFARPLSPARAQAESIDIRIAGDLKTWTRIAAEAFATPEMSADFLEEVMSPLAHAKSARCYLAYVDGEPAGSASMFLSTEQRVAGLFGAGTRPHYRRRGVQSAMLQRRLEDAAEAGCDVAIVTTLPGSDSHRNVARRGFELMYTKISMRLPLPG
jgi:GNAT superfamily N-acetyltransferase